MKVSFARKKCQFRRLYIYNVFLSTKLHFKMFTVFNQMLNTFHLQAVIKLFIYNLKNGIDS